MLAMNAKTAELTPRQLRVTKEAFKSPVRSEWGAPAAPPFLLATPVFSLLSYAEHHEHAPLLPYFTVRREISSAPRYAKGPDGTKGFSLGRGTRVEALGSGSPI